MNFKIIINLIKYDGLLLFADTKNIYQSKIIELLVKADVKFRLIEKSNFFLIKDNQYLLHKFIYYLIFFLNRNAKKILFVAQPYYSIFYIFLNKFILVSYDCHYGLPNINFLKIFLEKFILKKVSSFIHRDLRLWVAYKIILKSKKNILIPDHSDIDSNSVKLPKKNYENITAVVLGWIDEKEVQISETVIKLLDLGVKIQFYIPEKCKSEISSLMIDLKKSYSNQVYFNKFIDQKKTLNEISKFHIGICPHSKKVSLINKIYRNYCGSSRVIDYIDGNLSILISKTAFFQRFIARSYNAQVVDIFEIDNCQNLKDLIFLLEKNNRKGYELKKIFDNKYLSKKLLKFIH